MHWNSCDLMKIAANTPNACGEAHEVPSVHVGTFIGVEQDIHDGARNGGEKLGSTLRLNPCALLLGMDVGAAAMEDSRALPQPTKQSSHEAQQFHFWVQTHKDGKEEPERYLFSHVHSSIAHSSQKGVATRVSTPRGRDEQHVGQPCSGIHKQAQLGRRPPWVPAGGATSPNTAMRRPAALLLLVGAAQAFRICAFNAQRLTLGKVAREDVMDPLVRVKDADLGI
ncbi:hypothetical protein QTO34_000186 [Cnephaeus nilssonii]|uniref:Uncharacterized protein n=1 Tax=Cnephaeus nilssonii TaxID=3371016 RepID=A0AA40IC33_CNENI|nr:hypothetical protein QTO34_000186 [Eptesicus nilssonii]